MNLENAEPFKFLKKILKAVFLYINILDLIIDSCIEYLQVKRLTRDFYICFRISIYAPKM